MGPIRILAIAVLAAGTLLSAGAETALAQDLAAVSGKDSASKKKQPSAANRFNRLFKGAAQFNLPPWEDGIHDPDNYGTTALQPPREAFGDLPKSRAGNRVDWVESLQQGKILPRADRLDPDKQLTVMDLNIVREVKGTMPDVVYPHKEHTEWLDCRNCHPKIFVPKKGANKISMAAILMGQYCGVCHGKVAFPVSECRLCHSKDKSPEELERRLKRSSEHKLASSAPPPKPRPAPKSAPVESVTQVALAVPGENAGASATDAVPSLDKQTLMTRGKSVYDDNCAGCHGAEGEGVPETFPPLTASPIANGPVAGHIDVVLNGRAETAMTPWRDMLSPEDIAAVVTYERNALGNTAGDIVQPVDVIAALEGGGSGGSGAAEANAGATAALMKKGAAVYADNCAGCHGINGEGVPDAFPGLAGSPVATGPVADHVAVVLDGRADTAMTPWRDMLSAEEIAAVITYERNSWGNDMGDVITASAIEDALAR